ncbi:MAG: flagellar hook-length control protein FliK [Candidatus Sericytochromatia bacterium]|nr:flagellar hook-length control protein FliK [Candidatus Sericytochromatia bacterium]
MTPVDLRAHASLGQWQQALPDAVSPMTSPKATQAFREEVRKTLQHVQARQSVARPTQPRPKPGSPGCSAERPAFNPAQSLREVGRPTAHASRSDARGADGRKALEAGAPRTPYSAGQVRATAERHEGSTKAQDARQADVEATAQDVHLAADVDARDATVEVTSREALAPELLALLAATVAVCRPEGHVEAAEAPSEDSASHVADLTVKLDSAGTLPTVASPYEKPAGTSSSIPLAEAASRPVGGSTDAPNAAIGQGVGEAPGAIGKAASALTAAQSDVRTIARHAGVEEGLKKSREEGTDRGTEGTGPRVTSIPDVGLADLKVSGQSGDRPRENLSGGDTANRDQSALAPTTDLADDGMPQAIGPVTSGAREAAGPRSDRGSAPVARTIAAEVQEAVRTGPRSIRMTLRPEALGEVQLRVALVGGGVRATLHVDSEDARDLIGRQLDQVRQTLVDQGIRVDRLEVVWRGAQGTDDQGQQAFQQGAQDRERQQQGREQPARRETDAWQQALNEAGLPADMQDIA